MRWWRWVVIVGVLVVALVGLVVALPLADPRPTEGGLPSQAPSANRPDRDDAARRRDDALRPSSPEAPADPLAERPRTGPDADELLGGEEPAASVWPVTAEGIQGAVAEAMPQLQSCYEEALAEVPDLAGRLVIELEIQEMDGIGLVTGVGVDGDFEDGPLEDCLLDALEGLQFDPPDEGGLVVNYPFQFETADEAADAP